MRIVLPIMQLVVTIKLLIPPFINLLKETHLAFEFDQYQQIF